MSAQRRSEPASSRRHITISRSGSTPAGATAQLPFSNGVLAGNTLYLAGVLGLDRESGRTPDDIEQEIRNALDQIKAEIGRAHV